MLFLKIECKQERMESLEFHYNELIQKHKLCLECMSKQRDDNETLKAVKQDLEVCFLFLFFYKCKIRPYSYL